LGEGTEVLTQILKRWAAEEPVAVVDLVDEQSGLENDDMRNHRIVVGIGVFGNIEILLNDSSGVGEERPVSADA
jgi:hypothetical protein